MSIESATDEQRDSVTVQRLVLQPWEPGPQVKRLDDWFGDLKAGMQPHECYREMRALAIKLEHRLIELENAENSHRDENS